MSFPVIVRYDASAICERNFVLLNQNRLLALHIYMKTDSRFWNTVYRNTSSMVIGSSCNQRKLNEIFAVKEEDEWNKQNPYLH